MDGISYAYKQDITTHGYRVGLLMASYAESTNRAHLRELYLRAGTLHDSGKLTIPESIINKTGVLSEIEKSIVQRHVLASAQILLLLGETDDVIACSLYHHENFNGTGYIFKVSGFEIPYIARLCRVCDVFDAMWEERPYRKGLPIPTIFRNMDSMLKDGAFDPTIYYQFKQMIGEVENVQNIDNYSDNNCTMRRRLRILQRSYERRVNN